MEKSREVWELVKTSVWALSLEHFVIMTLILFFWIEVLNVVSIGILFFGAYFLYALVISFSMKVQFLTKKCRRETWKGSQLQREALRIGQQKLGLPNETGGF